MGGEADLWVGVAVVERKPQTVNVKKLHATQMMRFRKLCTSSPRTLGLISFNRKLQSLDTHDSGFSSDHILALTLLVRRLRALGEVRLVDDQGKISKLLRRLQKMRSK